VLEIGTGFGYQAAVLGQLADQVYSVEIIEEIALQARNACPGWICQH
jgi:protein-L-isoaspartate(D-aspartate) O-methyltransferase